MAAGSSRNNSNRVCVVIYDFEPRGVQRVQIRLANEFSSLGYDVDALVFNCSGPLLSTLSPSVSVVDLSAHSAKSAFFKIIKYLFFKKPQAIFSAEDHINIVALIACQLVPVKIKCVVSCHVSPKLWALKPKLLSKRWYMVMLAKVLYPKADKCVAISSGMKQEYLEILGINPGKITVIYNPVLSLNSESSVSDFQHPWLNHPNIKVVLGVGNLSRIKGFDDLIRAFSLLQSREFLRLIIVGDGPEMENLVSLSNELGLREFIDFVGYSPTPESFMNLADVFVLTSRSEGLPTVLIEAIGAGCPVVSTRCGGGAVEIMEDGDLGPLVDVSDVEGICEAVNQALNNPIKKSKLIKSSERFSSSAIAMEYLERILI